MRKCAVLTKEVRVNVCVGIQSVRSAIAADDAKKLDYCERMERIVEARLLTICRFGSRIKIRPPPGNIQTVHANDPPMIITRAPNS